MIFDRFVCSLVLFFFTENVIYYRIEKIIGVLDEHSACYREKRLYGVVCYWTEYDDSTEKNLKI